MAGFWDLFFHPNYGGDADNEPVSNDEYLPDHSGDAPVPIIKRDDSRFPTGEHLEDTVYLGVGGKREQRPADEPGQDVDAAAIQRTEAGWIIHSVQQWLNGE